MSNYGAVAISGGMQGPTFSKLGSEITSARSADVTMGSSLSSGQGMLILFADMRSALQSIQQSTFQTAELLKNALTPDPAADRDKDISAGDTDTDDPPIKGPGVLKRTLGAVRKGIGSIFGSTLGKLGLALGGLALLNMFGDDMVPYLADMIRTVKEGKIGEKIKESYEYLKDKGFEAFENIKFYSGKFIDGVSTAMLLIKDAYNFVNDYISKFDTRGTRINLSDYGMGGRIVEVGDGRLDKSEFADLSEDLMDKAAQLMKDYIGFTWDAVKGALLATSFLGLGLRIAGSAAITSIFGSTAVAAAAAPKGGAAKGALATTAAKNARLGAGGMFAIGAMIIYGITETYANISESIIRATDEQGDIDVSDFFAYLVGGEAKGGLGNALSQGFKLGGTGALVGMAVGTAFAPGIGTLIGGLAGIALFGLGGALTGYIGSDEMKIKLEKFAATIGTAVDTVGNFFTDLIAGFEAMFDESTETSFFDAFNRRRAGDVVGIKDDITTTENQIEIMKKRIAANPKDTSLPKQLENLENLLIGYEGELVDAPANQAKNTLIDVNKQIKTATKNLEDALDPRNPLGFSVGLYPGADADYWRSIERGDRPKGDLGSEEFKSTTPHGGGLKYATDLPYKEQVIYYTNELKKLNLLKNELGNLTQDEIIDSTNFKNYNMFSNSLHDEYMAKRLSDLGMRVETKYTTAGDDGQGFVIGSGNVTTTNLDNGDKSFHFGGHRIINPENTAQALIHKNNVANWRLF